MGVLERLDGTTLATRTVTLCLNPGLKAEWDKAAARLEEAAAQDARFGSLAMENTTAAVEAMDEIRDRMKATEVTFELQALDWTRRLALQVKHPPREGNLIDQARGFNVETYGPELIKASCLSVTDADGDTVKKVPAATWARLFKNLNYGQFNELYSAVSTTTDLSPTVPSSARFLLPSQDSGASSTPPSPGMSPRNGSGGGSRRTSRSTRTTKKAASAR